MTNTEQTPVTLESADLPLADYRALREGRDVSKLDLSTPAADAVTPKPVADGTTTSEENGTVTPPEDKTTEAKPKPDKLNARFSELTQKIKTLESQLAGKAGTGQPEAVAKPAEVPVLPPDPSDPEPSVDKFTDYTEWLKQWNRWDRRQETRQSNHAEAVAKVQTEAVAKGEAWNERVKAASAELPDFETVAQNPDLPVSKIMGDAILESEVGTKILYKLGQNPDEAARIAKLSPISQVREIGKLEAAVLAESATSDETPAVETPIKQTPVSKAPPPITPVRGAAAASPASRIDSMTQAEYRAYRESGKIR